MCSKKAVLTVAQRTDVGMMALAEGKESLNLNSATQTNRVPVVWSRGYDGTGTNVAILESDIVDFTANSNECPSSTNPNNCFRNPGPILSTGNPSEGDHATLVASVVGSNHPTYKGMAPGVRIISATSQGTKQGAIDGLVWAIDQAGAHVVNYSAGFCTGPNGMDIIDRAFDYYARLKARLLVVASGNSNCPTFADYVVSPGKAWNVLTVGAYNDQSNADWPDDVMSSFSSWRNPNTSYGALEKPEIVAVGENVVGIGLNGNLITNYNLNSGTSFAAPQVSGLAALLIHRTSYLSGRPESLRAIIIASANHNIEGTTGIPGGTDLRDGAGGINAAFADTVASTYASSTCNSSCWWYEVIYPAVFDAYGYRYYNFNANAGDRIRVAIAWDSQVDCPSTGSCSYDRLDTDLNFGIMDANYNFLSGAWAASYANSYELLPANGEFVIPTTGLYRIAVHKARFDEIVNFLGIALSKTYNIHLPLVIR
jgi:hypothetical protein